MHESSAYTSKVSASFNRDGAGQIVIDGDKTAVEWEHHKTDSDGIYYKVYIGTNSRKILYITDVTSEAYQLLVVYLDDDNVMPQSFCAVFLMKLSPLSILKRSELLWQQRKASGKKLLRML